MPSYAYWSHLQYSVVGMFKKVLPFLCLALLLAPLARPQPACYTTCGQGGCSPTSSLACTQCNPGTTLLNLRCVPVGSQSQPIRILAPLDQNTLDTSTLQQLASRTQVQCGANNGSQAGNVTYLNVTVTRNLVYTFRLPQVSIRAPHQYLTIRFNAVLFNQNNSQSIRLLVIDGNDRRVIDTRIAANQPDFRCAVGGQFQVSRRGFYVSNSISSESNSIFISISTLEPGDELGISNIEIYYGNCFTGCASCSGPASTQCLSCSNLLDFDANTKSCTACPSRFYKVNQMCYPCPYNCAACTYNVTSASTQCTQCQQGLTAAAAPACEISNFIIQTQNTTRFSEGPGWNSTAALGALVTNCGSYSVVGGLPLGLGGSTLAKTYADLPVHSQLWIKFNLLMIDQVTGSVYTAFVSVNGIRVANISVNIDSSVMDSNQCGTQNQQFIQTVVIPNITHTSPTAKVQILGLGNYFGIRDFTLGVVNSTNLSTCAEANTSNQCIRCKNGFSLTPVNGTACVACPAGTYLNASVCMPCSVYCRTCVTLNRCTSCDAPLRYNQATQTCSDDNNNLYSVALTQGLISRSSNGWQFYPRLQNAGLDRCGNYSIVGSSQLLYRQITMSRNFTGLPSHQGVSVHFHFYQIDNYDGLTNNSTAHGVSFKINNRTVPYTVSRTGFNICGNDTFDAVTKIVLNDSSHTASTLTLQISANRTKFGISDLLLFLTSCDGCEQNGISYQLETIPLYSVESSPLPTEKGMKSKIIFSDRIETSEDPRSIFQVRLVNSSSLSLNSLRQGGSGFETGQRDPYEIVAGELVGGKELRLFHNLVNDELGRNAVATLGNPEAAFGRTSGEQGTLKSLRLAPVSGQFSRYDDIYSITDTEGQQYRANLRNFMNLFRGISILALFIGLLSFFVGLSQLFDDLFVLCQVIFVHIFIQSQWISASMKLPVGAMNLVQFMAWLPIQGRNVIENVIIPANHYQKSPIVYEQFWKDITFARAIYHTVIFLVVMLAFYLLVRVIRALRQPKIQNIMQITQQRKGFIETYYYRQTRIIFVFLDKVIRFSFFTVMWACCLQFIHFSVQPTGFMIWNSILCIAMFVAYVVYVFVGYYYLRSEGGIMQRDTFKQKFDGIRLQRQGIWYFVFRYMKLLAIAFIVGQLHSTNPLAVLIPLIVLHLVDAAVIASFGPFLNSSTQTRQIISKCSGAYWLYYTVSHIVENCLFVVLEVIMIIMYASRSTAGKDSYMAIGYACVAFVLLLLVNGLVRLVWGFIRLFEICVAGITRKEQEIQTQDDISPLKYQDLYRANQENDVFATDRRENRSPSIELKIGRN